MVAMDKDKLYDCGYKAWNFGPVEPKLYKRYKNCGKDDIILKEIEIEQGNSIDETKKELEISLNLIEKRLIIRIFDKTFYKVYNLTKVSVLNTLLS